MATISNLDRVASIVLRYLRPPLLVLIAVYAVGITGMLLMPGPVVDGEPSRMTLFHAFYFITYTATTTGFGELPASFSEPQRLWAVVCLYSGIIAWLYAVGALFRLTGNPHFIEALAERRFARSVRSSTDPFYIICGFGDTGSLLTRGLSESGLGAVVIDGDAERVKALRLRDYRMKVFGLTADPSMPKHLLDAGLTHPCCLGVVALTSNEHINLKIAVMARYLNPSLRVVCRSTSARHQEELAMLDSVEVVDPFALFADRLSVALNTPELHIFQEWLVGAHSLERDRSLEPPRGKWVLCGYGRMGRHLHACLRQHGVSVAVIDPQMHEAESVRQQIVGHTTERTLREAEVDRAAGLVAGTDSDSDNLSILLRARALNPNIFLVVRQNRHEHELAFNAANANLIMQPSLISARSLLVTLISEMLPALIEHLRHHPDALSSLMRRVRERARGGRPHIWEQHIDIPPSTRSAVSLEKLGPLTLAKLCQDPSRPGRALPCIPMVLARQGERLMLPDNDLELCLGDRILFCGRPRARRILDSSLHNSYTLRYLLTGEDEARGYVLGWFARWWRGRRAASGPLPR